MIGFIELEGSMVHDRVRLEGVIKCAEWCLDDLVHYESVQCPFEETCEYDTTREACKKP